MRPLELTTTIAIPRPVPRWVHAWSILTVCCTAVLLTLGGLVTTFRAGMADPVWPTTPWYLLATSWAEPRPGFLIEHSHRLAGFIVGAVAATLAIGLWLTDPWPWARWGGLAGLVVLLAAFGQFHGEMMKQVKAPHVTVPMDAIAGMAAGLAVVLACAITGLAAGTRGAGLRALGVVALVAVMVQGLLGGFRVRLNELVGIDLAAFHGVFAQVVFALLVGLAVLTAAPPARAELPEAVRQRCRRLATILAGIVFVQLIWGSLVRHNPTPAVQRLHLIFAFAVVAQFMSLVKFARSVPAAWARLRPALLTLSGLVVVQVLLGVEAWMGKFQAGLPLDLVPLQKVTPGQAAIRTAHVLVGTGVLAASVAAALLAWRKTVAAADEPAPTSQDIPHAVLSPSGGVP
jgi:cytochrome c oxidase assembly protein subunit 15